MYLLSLFLGILSWCLGGIAIGRRGGYGLCISSFACCAVALWVQLKALDTLLNVTEDVSGAMDTVGAVTLAAGVLIAVTILLNGIAFLRGRKS